MSAAPDHPLLTVHDIHDLRDTLRALNVTLTRIHEEAMSQSRAMVLAIQKVTEHTEGLPALVELLARATTNGHAEQGDTQ